MSSPSDRFQVVETALMPPGVCRVCGGASKPWYIDFGYQEEYYGSVYYCSECVGAMAAAAGFLTPAEKRELEQKVSDLESEAFNLRVRSDGLEKALDGLHSAGFVVSRDPGWVDLGAPEPAFAGAEAEPGSGDPGGAREGTPAEPSSEQGVDDVRPARGVEESGTGGFRFSV